MLWGVDAVKSRRAEYAEQTRVALLDAARRAFAEHGFADTSIAAVAAAARVTKVLSTITSPIRPACLKQ